MNIIFFSNVLVWGYSNTFNIIQEPVMNSINWLQAANIIEDLSAVLVHSLGEIIVIRL